MAVKVCAIVVAAGKGKRLKGQGLQKPYLNLAGKPILARSLKAISASGLVASIILVVNKKNIQRAKNLIRRFKLGKVGALITGGKERFKSVRNGFKAIADKYDYVLVHDGARPLVPVEDIDACIKEAIRYKAAILAAPATDTVKKISRGNFIKQTINRKEIYLAQTPQVFERQLLKRAYLNAGHKHPQLNTDDSQLVEALGVAVKIVEGSPRNIKITTREDLKIAQGIINAHRHRF